MCLRRLRNESVREEGEEAKRREEEKRQTRVRIQRYWPSFGDTTTPGHETLFFYNAWEDFTTRLSFAHCEEHKEFEAQLPTRA